MEDVQKVYSLFLDEHRSTVFLQEYQDQYVFSKQNMASGEMEGLAQDDNADAAGADGMDTI